MKLMEVAKLYYIMVCHKHLSKEIIQHMYQSESILKFLEFEYLPSSTQLWRGYIFIQGWLVAHIQKKRADPI